MLGSDGQRCDPVAVGTSSFLHESSFRPIIGAALLVAFFGVQSSHDALIGLKFQQIAVLPYLASFLARYMGILGGY